MKRKVTCGEPPEDLGLGFAMSGELTALDAIEVNAVMNF